MIAHIGKKNSLSNVMIFEDLKIIPGRYITRNLLIFLANQSKEGHLGKPQSDYQVRISEERVTQDSRLRTIHNYNNGYCLAIQDFIILGVWANI